MEIDHPDQLLSMSQEQFRALEDELRSIPLSQRQSPAADETIRKLMRFAKVIVTRLGEREPEPLPRGTATKALRIVPDILRRWDCRKTPRVFSAIVMSCQLVFEEERLKELTKSVSHRRKRLIQAGLYAFEEAVPQTKSKRSPL